MNRILIAALLATVCSLATQAQQQADSVVFRFIIRNDMFFMQSNEAEIERLYGFTDRYYAEITAGQMPVRVDGYCSDLKIARTRSNRIKSWLILKKGLFKVSKDLKDLKYSQDAKETEQPVEQPKPQQTVEQPQPVEKPQPEPQPTTPAVSVSVSVPAPVQDGEKFFLRTNLLYWAVAMPNLGIEWKPSNRTGILLNGAYSHWAWNSESKQHRTWLVQPEIRRYFGESRRWFAGIEGHAAEFNFKFGDTGYQGKAFGGGITGGYRMPLSNCFDWDFSLGLGYTRLEYDSYYRSNNVMVRKESGIKKNVFAPTQAGVSLIWKIK
ncbi:MAG: DUF3575 domain-containing protein [Bacteroidales bacterium]|jgi:hypothetical protein|nr:DUF3575 domain-containing protein [Bacteroidales bacterium]